MPLTLFITLLVVPVPDPPATGGDGECACTEARERNVWCVPCERGYVAGVAVPSAMIYEVLDAHGHDIDPESIRCESCQDCLKRDGFCPRCRMGFVSQQLYFSRLTWVLARGEQRPADLKASCEGCGSVSSRPVWCTKHGVGQVGTVFFRRREHFDIAAREHRFLLASIRKLSDCEMCAAAKFTGSRCPRCKISWQCSCEKERENDGWCRRCEVGHFGGVEIPSRKLHEAVRTGPLSRGKALQNFQGCASCRRAEESWCTACSHGVVGNRVFSRREEHLRARDVWRRLSKALPSTVTCEGCALATFRGGSCEECSPQADDPDRSGPRRARDR